MTVLNDYLRVRTKGHGDVVDLTPGLRDAVERSDLVSGIATLFIPGSTASLSTIEYDPGAVKDVQELLERLAPAAAHYHHHQTWGDENGSAHVRACLMGPSLVIPFQDRKPSLGTWQQVVLIDFDTRARERDVVLQLMGE